MQAHTNQPIERFAWHRSCAYRHALPFYFFLSTFNTTKHIIDFVVLLHWTTQHNKSASLNFGLRWQFLKKKKKKKKKSMAKFAKLVLLAAVQLFYFLSFFFFIWSKQKKRRERSKSNFWKGLIKTNVCCNAVPETQPPLSSINQAQGVFLQVDAAVLHLHNHHPACLLPPPANQVV